jgi:cellulose synthase/poly-beta-1,6-N-acetylglucosamine synthase-like glycosyltransferase
MGAGLAIAVPLMLDPIATLITLNAIGTAAYLVVLGYNLLIFRQLIARPTVVTVGDEMARSIPDAELPRYTVMVAAYREAEVIGRAIKNLEALDYPDKKLEILILLEADDVETYEAALAANPGPRVEIIRVPYAKPRTKPKACNYGLTLCSGELVTIYDAEDRPEPLQLRRAAAAFMRLDPSVICLQARLQYHNVEQNILTRWFSAEYVTWFAGMLPALVALNAPIPLGGTSMHVKRAPLEAVGAWDPHNVTEDADLGMRLHRLGYRTMVLDSYTYEEANSDFINWVKQRSRWYKGYLQTWLVHLRHPVQLWQDLGPAGFIGFNVLVGGTPVLALLNPLFWLLAVLWFGGHIDLIQAIFPAWLYYPAMISLILGNFLAFYRTVLMVRLGGYPSLVIAVLLSPVYWVMMSIAALRACLQLIVNPSHWEKTTHGLDRPAVKGVAVV